MYRQYKNYQDSYNGSIGDEESCGTSLSYLNGNDVFYSYYFNHDMSVNVSMTPDATYSGIFVYDSCESVGVSMLCSFDAIFFC